MVSLRDVAQAVKAAPERNFNSVVLVRGDKVEPLPRPKTSADVRTEPVAYLEEACRLLDTGPRKEELVVFVTEELRRVGARDPIPREALSPTTRELWESLRQ